LYCKNNLSPIVVYDRMSYKQSKALIQFTLEINGIDEDEGAALLSKFFES